MIDELDLTRYGIDIGYSVISREPIVLITHWKCGLLLCDSSSFTTLAELLQIVNEHGLRCRP